MTVPDARVSGGKVSLPCETCGAPFTLDTAKFFIAVHDCDAGEWYLLRRQIPAAKTRRKRKRK